MVKTIVNSLYEYRSYNYLPPFNYIYNFTVLVVFWGIPCNTDSSMCTIFYNFVWLVVCIFWQSAQGENIFCSFQTAFRTNNQFRINLLIYLG